MSNVEHVEFLANALISEVSRGFVCGEGEQSAIALMEMSINELPSTFKQFCSERFTSDVSGKGFWGTIGTGLKFLAALKDVEKHLCQLTEWAGALAGDRIEAATLDEIRRYALSDIKFSAATRSVVESLMIERGL